MVEIILVKRPAKQGEIGLFMETPIFQEEWDSLPQGQDIKAECTVPANLKYLKFFWALIDKVNENSPDGFVDKEDCKQRVLLEARHYKIIQEPLTGKTEIKSRSVAGLSADTWIRLLKRCTHVVITRFMPEMEENVLKNEISQMLGMDVFEKSSRTKGGVKGRPSDNRGAAIGG